MSEPTDTNKNTPDPADPGNADPGTASPGTAKPSTASPSTAAHASPWRPGSFLERIGAALAAPRCALAEADESHAAGAASSDIAGFFGLFFLATYTREIVSAVWISATESVLAGIRGLAGVLSQALATDLAILFVAAFALTLLAGQKRAMGRDFDLACVAFIPLVAVRLAAEAWVNVSGAPLTGVWPSMVGVAAYGWAGVVLVMAWQTARARRPNSSQASNQANSSQAGSSQANSQAGDS